MSWHSDCCIIDSPTATLQLMRVQVGVSLVRRRPPSWGIICRWPICAISPACACVCALSRCRVCRVAPYCCFPSLLLRNDATIVSLGNDSSFPDNSYFPSLSREYQTQVRLPVGLYSQLFRGLVLICASFGTHYYHWSTISISFSLPLACWTVCAVKTPMSIESW